MTLLAALALSGGAAAQPGQPAVVQARETSRGPEGVPARNADEDLVLPFPPPDTVPPMPFPEPEPGPRPPRRGGFVQFDAQTGRLTQLPDITGVGHLITAGDPGLDGGGMYDTYMGRSFGTMQKVTNSTVSPFRYACKLIMRFTDQSGSQHWFSASGAMIDARTVITAGHCVYVRYSGWTPFFSYADVIYVIPAWDGQGSTQPPPGPGSNAALYNFGYATSTSYLSTTDWVANGNFDGDMAVIRLSDRAVGKLTGWFSTGWEDNCTVNLSRYYGYAGYPSENCGGGLHTGKDMYYWGGTFHDCPDNQLHITASPGCFTTAWGGMSGGAFYYSSNGLRVAQALCSTSDRAYDAYACKLTESFVNTIANTFIPYCRGTIFDLQPLDLRLNKYVQHAGWNLSGDVGIVNPTNASRSGTFTLRIYVSNNDNITSGDLLLSTQTFTLNFGPMGGTRVSLAPFTIPGALPEGSYYVGVILDPATDTNTSNNATHTWDTAPLTVQIAAASNDDCANAMPITVGTVYGDSTIASVDGSATCGNSNSTQDIWYVFESPDTGTAYFDTCGSAIDTVISLHSGCPGTTANQISCSDDHGGAAPCTDEPRVSYLSLPMVTGQRVYIRVSGYNTFHGPFQLNVSMPPPPNDHCEDAVTITPGTVVGSTRQADTDGAATCGQSFFTPDVWYKFTTYADCTATLNTCGSAFDTVLSVHDSCPGSFDSQTACNDDAGSLGPCAGTYDSFASFTAPRATYLVRVSGFNGLTGDFSLNLEYTPPPYDACEHALPVALGTQAFSTYLCTTDGPTEANCSFCCNDLQIHKDMWFSFLPHVGGIYSFDTLGSGFDTKIALYDGCPTAANQAFACNDDYHGGTSLVYALLSAGRPVTIRVGGYAGAGTLTTTLLAPVCETDINQDGNSDQGDVDCLIAAIAGDQSCVQAPFFDLDFNQDGNADQSDIDALITTISGGGCP